MARIRAVSWLAGVCAAVAVFALPSVGLADVVVSQKTEYYQVRGKNGLELSREMLRGGRRNISLRHAIAATATRFQVQGGQVVVRDGRCVVEGVKIRLDIGYYYPKWAKSGPTSAALRRAWNTFYDELIRHEETHGRIARQGAQQMLDELRNVSSDARFRCFNFRQKANMVFNRVSRQIKQRQLAFDRKESRRTSRISQLQMALMKTE